MWAWLCSFAIAAENHTWARQIQQLEVDNAVGDLHLEIGGERIEVQLVPIERENCDLTVGEEGARAVVRIKDRTRGADPGCRINVAVQLPAGARAEIEVGAGDAHVVQVNGQVQLAVGAGDVRFEGGGGFSLDVGAGSVTGTMAGASRIRVGAGDVHLEALTAPIDAEVGTGGIYLGYDAAPEGEISAHTGIGNVEVDLPDGTVVAPTGQHGGVTLPVADGAPTRVDVLTGLGRTQVH